MKKLTPKVKAFICTMLFGMVLLGFVVSETFLKAFVYVCSAALLIVWLYAVYKILESLSKSLNRQ